MCDVLFIAGALSLSLSISLSFWFEKLAARDGSTFIAPHLLHGHLSPELYDDHTVCKETVSCLYLPEMVEERRVCPLQDLCQSSQLLPA